MSVEQQKRGSGDDRRAAIGRAAREIIVEKGLEGLRTRDIAARVGINIATLHYHVPSKEALVSLVAETIRDQFKQQAARHPREGKTALELLRMEFDDFAETMDEAPDLIILLAELTERARRDVAISAIMAPMGSYWRSQLADILRLGIEDGSFRADIDPVSGALLITGALSELARTRGKFGPAPQLFAEIERAFVRPSNKS
ncbi:TetR/AcrR family transcriptional regulator [Devosia rhizoryzae]|uniref:TetR/AcrR family transcriptional regulator n=1 Tax=Devosia rhizoryzae TaxID=2774137 RepID=A0ABX7C633_9HYPH|nr:TetR/AcrR family transcriptional regulator [Devosia rhizoryzae]QQR39683.1 TetR/AcrR family transcriptional regulator [Devosia rhizoryzae]